VSSLLARAAAQHGSLEHAAYRPWPLPDRPWLLAQSWEELLLAHYRVDAAALRPHVPHPLELDQHDGSAWVSLTPFRAAGTRLRGTLPVPRVSEYLGLNCRTYVRDGSGRSGIWFFTLDASARLAVETARRLYRLPCRYARMSFADGAFESSRAGAEGVSFSARYRGVGPARAAEPGSVDHFLAERYCLYADHGRRRADVHHAPWPLQEVEGAVELHSIAPIALEGEPLLRYASRVDVLIWSLERVPFSG
jgi:uncharacterized protein YqjF (DUF2071 family)